MSFQNFRLHTVPPQPAPFVKEVSAGPSSLAQAFNQPQVDPALQNAQSSISHASSGQKKNAYGSGDADDGYTLVFPSMAAFQDWRQREEEEKMIEFVKGDTHGSKAVPPRFKDHTKLVCARHSRSGKKKYVKKFPDRVRKVPSRKLEGLGCPASISYKTYFDSDEVRAMYISEHSHEIGLANLPFTKRGRKAQAEAHSRNKTETADGIASSSTSPSATSPPHLPAANPGRSSMSTSSNGIAGPSSVPSRPQNAQPAAPPGHISHTSQAFQSAISMLAPLPPQQPPQPPIHLSQERWDRMSVLFESVRDHARSFEYPAPSVAALESVLIRLYLESPVGGMAGAPNTLGGMDLGMGEISDPGHMGT